MRDDGAEDLLQLQTWRKSVHALAEPFGVIGCMFSHGEGRFAMSDGVIPTLESRSEVWIGQSAWMAN